MLKDAAYKHVYIAVGYTDMRSGLDALVYKVKNEFRLDPCDQESLFLFCGRRTDRIKALTFEGDGFLLLTKRLTDGRYRWPRSENEARSITLQQYRWLMDGLEIEQKKVIKESTPRLF